VLTCARFGQWPFANPAHAMTYAQMTLVILAQRNPTDDARPLPPRYWRDWRDRVLRLMRQQSNGT